MGTCSSQRHQAVPQDTVAKGEAVSASTISIVHRHKGESYEGTNYIYERAAATEIKQEGGTTKTVVCVHGIGSFGGDFEGTCKHMKALGYDVLRYDLIGRGFSAFPADGMFGAAAHVAQLRNLIVHLGLSTQARDGHNKYHMVGHSMGGALVALYASEYTDEIESITLLSPAGLMDLGTTHATIYA
jgi:pimeloyl-ACP methyl ester carboxylesterase